MSETMALNDLARESRGFEAFREEAQEIITINREQWLRVEYDAVVRGSVQGESWHKLEETKEVYPYWTFVTSESDKTCDQCAALNGLVFKIGDPEGDAVYPQIHFNCECYADPTDDSELNKEGKEVSKGSDYLNEINPDTGKPYVSPDFRFNAGKQGPLPNNSDYFQVLKNANKVDQELFDFE